MPLVDNLVHEISASTGTGNLTLARSGGEQRFSEAFEIGAVFDYFAWNRDAIAAEWEVGEGHMSDADTFVRDTVLFSSNAGAAVNFSAGTKDITNGVSANKQKRTGEIIAWPTATIPDYALECDGSAVSRMTYAALFAVIGETYGDGDESTTFNLPDYRGWFLRGVNGGAGVDPDAASRTDRGDGTTGDNVGTVQQDAFKEHSHNTGRSLDSGSGTARNQPTSAASNPIATSVTGGNETRPKNKNVHYCIVF